MAQGRAFDVSVVSRTDRASTYEATATGPGEYRRPWIPIVVRSRGIAIWMPGPGQEELRAPQTKGWGLIDSGAWRTVIPWRFVKPWGIRWNDLDDDPESNRFRGFVESPVKRLSALVMWEGHVITDCPYVIHPESLVRDVILGTEDFLTKFDVTFRWGDDPPTFTLTRR